MRTELEYLYVRNNVAIRNDYIGLTPYSVWHTAGCDISQIDESARTALKKAVALMNNPLNACTIQGEGKFKAEYYGQICCDKCNKVTFTGPVRGYDDRRSKLAAFPLYANGDILPHSYPKTDPRVKCPKGTVTVAYYHTHPSGSNFSNNDKGYIKSGANAYYMSNGMVFKRLVPQKTDDISDVNAESGAMISGSVSGYPLTPRLDDLTSKWK